LVYGKTAMISGTASPMPVIYGKEHNSEETLTMILLDSDVMIDLLRHYSPAIDWFDTLSSR